MLYNLPADVLTRKGTTTLGAISPHPSPTHGLASLLTVVAATVGLLATSAMSQTLSVGVVFSGTCDGGETTLIRNTAETVKQDHPYPELDYGLLTVCGESLDEMTQALNGTFGKSVTASGYDSVIVVSRPQFCYLPILFASEANKVTVSPNCPVFGSSFSGQFSATGRSWVISLQSSVISLTSSLDVMLRHYQWQTLHFVVSVEPVWLQLSQSVSLKLASSGYTVKTFQAIPNNASSYDMEETFRVIGQDSKGNTSKKMIPSSFVKFCEDDGKQAEDNFEVEINVYFNEEKLTDASTVKIIEKHKREIKSEMKSQLCLSELDLTPRSSPDIGEELGFDASQDEMENSNDNEMYSLLEL